MGDMTIVKGDYKPTYHRGAQAHPTKYIIHIHNKLL